MQHYAQVRMNIISVFNENNNGCPNLYLPEGYYLIYISCSSLQFNMYIHIVRYTYIGEVLQQKNR